MSSTKKIYISLPKVFKFSLACILYNAIDYLITMETVTATSSLKSYVWHENMAEEDIKHSPLCLCIHLNCYFDILGPIGRYALHACDCAVKDFNSGFIRYLVAGSSQCI